MARWHAEQDAADMDTAALDEEIAALEKAVAWQRQHGASGFDGARVWHGTLTRLLTLQEIRTDRAAAV